MVEIRLPILINKRNGQINSYLKKKDLPREVKDLLRKKNSKKSFLLMDFKELI